MAESCPTCVCYLTGKTATGVDIAVSVITPYLPALQFGTAPGDRTGIQRLHKGKPVTSISDRTQYCN